MAGNRVMSYKPSVEPSTMSSEQVREISHDEFNPVGTLTLITLYFLILIILWTFVYFIEFLGRELTVIGAIV